MKKALFYLTYFLSPIGLVAILYLSNPTRYSSLQFLVPMVIGVLAYSWFCWQFVLSARPKFIDHLIGLDKVYRLHGIMAIISLVLVFVHKIIFENLFGESLTTLLGSIGFYIFLGVSILSLVLMTKSKWQGLIIIKPIVKLINAIDIFKYEHYKLLHNLTIFALVFTQTHVLLTSGARQSRLVFSAYMISFIVSIMFYLYHKVLRPWIFEENKCEIVEVRLEAEKLWSISFKPLNHEFKYKPGQFAFFKILLDGHNEEHPFSISSAPDMDGNISITVKELGDFTNKISKLRVGDQLIIDGPYGEFSHIKYPREKQNVFIAGGVGITPVMSMLRYIKEHDPNRDVLLLWGMRTIEDFAFKEEINDMLTHMPYLKVIPVVSNDDNYEGEKGFIDYIKLLNYLSKLRRSVSKTGFYICGPQILMNNSIMNLKKMDIPPNRIHYESFSL